MKRFTSHRAKITPLVTGGPGRGHTNVSQKASTSTKSGEAKAAADKSTAPKGRDKELGGPEGLEPTRYGDWERKGICYDF